MIHNPFFVRFAVVVSQDRQVNEQDASMFVSSIITTAGASNATTGNGIEGRYFSRKCHCESFSKPPLYRWLRFFSNVNLGWDL